MGNWKYRGWNKIYSRKNEASNWRGNRINASNEIKRKERIKKQLRKKSEGSI